MNNDNTDSSSNPYTTPKSDEAAGASSLRTTNPSWTTFTAAAAAFFTYFCMYGIRKPFTAATYEGYSSPFGEGELKVVLVLFQLVGYMSAKFIGVKVVSEMKRTYRALALIVLMGIAELALVGFAFLPMSLKPFLLFLNGISLGMIYGLVMAYLEGRKQTELLAAVLSASFISSSGVVKSVGRALIVDYGVSEFSMPYITGLIFYVPMLFCVWLLNRTPEPSAEDLALRRERPAMSPQQRRDFFNAYRPGLIGLLLAFIGLTVIRTMRDDFGVEIWQALGVQGEPAVFAKSETLVAIIATVLNAFAIYIVSNRIALRTTSWLMGGSFILVALATLAQWSGQLSAFPFMVLCGIGLYIPYVAYHTTVFERLLALSHRPGNIGFLMYMADSLGYLGYAAVLLWNTFWPPGDMMFPYFRITLLIVATLCMAGVLFADVYFQRMFRDDATEAKGKAA